MRRVAAVVLFTLGFCVMSAAGTARAATVSCRVGQFRLAKPDGSPAIAKLRATGLPALTTGYAPRCLVADAVAFELQNRFGSAGRLPTKLRIYGARWDAGTWRVRYTGDRNPILAVVTKIGAPSRRVTMSLTVSRSQTDP